MSELLLLPPTAKSFFWYWGPALLMIAAIVLESTDMLSATRTGSFLLPFLQNLLPGLSPGQIATVHIAIRKAGHAIGYGLLSWFLFRGWWGSAFASQRSWQLRFALFGFLGATCMAIADELHQMTIPSRGGSLHDMVLDSSAALFTQLIIYFILRRRARSIPSIPAYPVAQ